MQVRVGFIKQDATHGKMCVDMIGRSIRTELSDHRCTENRPIRTELSDHRCTENRPIRTQLSPRLAKAGFAPDSHFQWDDPEA